MEMSSKFSDKVISLRKERGISQEQLADRLEVSRQAVSKWEGDQSMPSLDKIIQIADYFGVSVDYLVRENEMWVTDKSKQEDRNSREVLNQLHELKQVVDRRNSNVYEYKSKRSIHGIPFVHVKLSRYGKPSLAKGIIAIGNVSVGVISVGAVSAGILSFGAFTFGLLLALGAFCIGSISAGAIAIGIYAFGGVAIGIYAFGGVALASKVAVGGAASATIAIGDSVSGDHTFDIAVATKEEVKQVILEVYPKIPNVVMKLVLMALKK